MLGYMSQTPQTPPAGWYPDPSGTPGERFWDGQAWSQATRDPQPSSSFEQAPQSGHAAQPGSYAQAPGGQPHPGSHGQMPPYGDPRAQSYNAASGKMVPVQGGYRLATFWWRVLGYLIDSIALGVLNGILTFRLQERISTGFEHYLMRVIQSADDPSAPLPELPSGLYQDFLMMTLIGVVLFAAYRALTVGLMQATLGQKICGLRVAKLGDESLAPVGWTTAIIRAIAGAVIYQLLAFLAQISVLFTDRKQTLPDMLSKTVVVNTREAV